ncbi:MAG: hypothetical protein NE330_07785 [Lentisphaeraceae bacterium]|nr:hypothetical protein [Lentisphaeraceae bacterium]
MKKILLILFLSLLVSVKAGEVIKHSFVAVDNKRKQVIKVDQFSAKNNWIAKFDIKPRALQKLSDETLLVGLENGFALLDLESGEVKERITGYNGIQSVCRLQDGRTLLGQDGDTLKFFLLDKNNKLERSFSVPGKYLRLTDITADNNLLFTSGEPWIGVCTDLYGKVKWTVPLPEKGYRLYPLENGNFLTSTGETAAVCEVAKDGKLIKIFGGEDIHPKSQLQWFSGFQTVGQNVVAANWLGHGKKGKGPHLVEFNQENELVWSWTDHKAAIQITNFLILK